MNPYKDQHLKMYFYENRLKTFEGWPFEDECLCTPENVSTRSTNGLARLAHLNMKNHIYLKINIMITLQLSNDQHNIQAIGFTI